MNITIVGAGAMGGLFGALLVEAGNNVCLFNRPGAHVDAIAAKGLQIDRNAVRRAVSVRAVCDRQALETAELVIVFVKSINTADVADITRQVAGDTGLVMTLQNGMGNADILARAVDPSRMIAGTTAHGATRLGPGVIRHAGKGPTTLGMWGAKDTAAAERVARILNSAGIATTVSDDVRRVVWHKLLVNVGINAITALTGIKNGQLLDLAASRNISRRAVEEAVAIARAHRIAVNDSMVRQVFEIAANTGANRSSMGQDVDNQRQTEISAINGFIVKEAEKLGLAAPVNQTLTALVETRQAHYDEG